MPNRNIADPVESDAVCSAILCVMIHLRCAPLALRRGSPSRVRKRAAEHDTTSMDKLVFEIVCEPGTLGGTALTVVDVLRLINRLHELKSPTSAPPIRWRLVRHDGRAIARSELTQLANYEKSALMPRHASTGHRAAADVIVVPGWLARDGSEINDWIQRSAAVIPRLQQTLAQGGAVLGVFTGVVLLAAAGNLHQRKFAAPWPFYVSVMHHMSKVTARPDASVEWSDAHDWINDRCVWTCATPGATIEALLDLLACTPLADIANAARDVLIPDPLRHAVAVVHARSSGPILERSRVPPGLVERAKKWLLQHLDEPYELNTLAIAAATSPRTLVRHFTSTLGVSPYQYLEKLRVERASQLLQTTYVPIEEVGSMSGMPSPSTFRRIFMKHVGQLPSEYRHRVRLRALRPRWRNDVSTSQTHRPS